MSKRKSLFLTYAVVLVAFFALVFVIKDQWIGEPVSEPEPTPPAVTTTQPVTTVPPATEAAKPAAALHSIAYPEGRFGPDEERLAYQDSTMTLRIPKLEYEGPVLDGTSLEVLENGVGLFEQAQLPGPENRNVSIAGHRDIHGKEFYNIDKLGEGDYIYLTYQGQEYAYLFEESVIVTPDNWDPVRIKDFSCVSLQSCTPVNIASHRIFVVGRLESITEIGGTTAN